MPFAARDNRAEDQGPGEVTIFEVSWSRGVDGVAMSRDLLGDKVLSETSPWVASLESGMGSRLELPRGVRLGSSKQIGSGKFLVHS